MARIFRHHVSPVKLTLAIVDAFAVFCATLGAEWLRYNWAGLEYDLTFVGIFAKCAITIVTMMILVGIGGYQGQAVSAVRVFFVRATIAIGISLIAFAVIAYLLPTIPLWRSILLLTGATSLSVLTLVHLAFVGFLDSEQLGRKVIILGPYSEAAAIKGEVEKTQGSGLYVSCNIEPSEIIDNALFEQVSASGIDVIVIGEDVAVKELPMQQLIKCKLSGVEVKDRLSFYEEVRGYVDLDAVKADWIVFADGFKGGHLFEKAAKRLLDIAISVACLLMTLPIMLLASLAIIVTSRGGVFYRQERVGLHGKVFNVLKLRSMYRDAEARGGPQFAGAKDPRITPIGRFLRASRIDEIPQVINVLRGDMSFVGPRPERPFFVEQLIKEVPFYEERHCLKPGITGWAQIRYPYGASFEDSRRKLEYDLYYIKNYSLFLDIVIILQTLRVVMFPEGVR